jgi:hypothetical protein
MRVTIEVNDGEVTSVTSPPAPSGQAAGAGSTVEAAGPGPTVQPMDMSVFSAGPAPVLPGSGTGAAGTMTAATASGAAGSSGQPMTEGISAGPAPAELVSGPGAAGAPPAGESS